MVGTTQISRPKWQSLNRVQIRLCYFSNLFAKNLETIRLSSVGYDYTGLSLRQILETHNRFYFFTKTYTTRSDP
jgi:hypothetical protein